MAMESGLFPEMYLEMSDLKYIPFLPPRTKSTLLRMTTFDPQKTSSPSYQFDVIMQSMPFIDSTDNQGEYPFIDLL